jgi:hypothetical protein
MDFLKQLPPRQTAWVIIGILVVLCIDIWSALVPLPHPVLQALDLESASQTRVAALLAANQGPFVLDAVEKTSNCVVDAGLPDHACTPGAVFTDATPAEICVSGYTKTVRNVSIKLRKQVYAAYDTDYPPPTGTYELDHLIPLALGGNNEAANLFPEARDPSPGFKEKDVVEVYLYEQMCAGHIPLAAAQAQIARNWLDVYKAIDPSDVARLKSKYKSWSN